MIQPFTPREIFSPSQIGVFSDCPAKWGYTYLLGLRGPPTKAAELGTRIHSQLERHFRGEPMQLDLDPEACRRAISGLHLFPDHREASAVEVEGVPTSSPLPGDTVAKFPITLDTVPILGERVEMTGYIDLAMAFGQDWYLFDHKSCRTYEYQFTPEDLGSSLQGNIYAYSLMQRHSVAVVPARWVYYRTEGAPDARATDWGFDLDSTVSNLKILLAPVLEMRNLIRLKVAADDLPKNLESCSKYGGCPHHPRKGGPCKVNLDLGKLVQSKLPKENQMAETLAEVLKRKRAAAAQALVPPPVATAPQVAPVAVPKLRIPGQVARNPISPPEADYVPPAAQEIDDDLPPVDAGEETEPETTDTEPAPAPAKRGRPKGTTKISPPVIKAGLPKKTAFEEDDTGAEKRYFLKEAAFAFAPTRTAEDPEVAALECAVFAGQLWDHIQSSGKSE